MVFIPYVPDPQGCNCTDSQMLQAINQNIALGLAALANKKSGTVLNSIFTRPADTTAYTIGDVVANSTAVATLNELFPASPLVGGGGVLQNLVLTKSGAVTTNAQFRAHLFTSGLATVPGQDNAGYGVKFANYPYYLGFVDFPVMTVGTGVNTGARAQADNLALAYQCGSQSLFWFLEALAAYTPAASEQFALSAGLLID